MSRQEEEEVEKKEYLGGGILGCQKAAEWGAATASIQGSQQSSTTGDSSREPFFGSGMSRQTTAASENEAQSASSSMIPVIITTTTAAAAAAAKGKVTFKSLNGVRHCKALRKWSLTTDPNQSLTFVFNYTPEVVEGFQRGTSTILLRVCQYDAGKHYQEDYLPATACISTNNGRVSSLLLLNIGTEALRRPVDLGGLLHLGSIDPKTVIAGKEPNSVVMHVFLEVMPPTSISYVAGIYLVTWFTWQELLDGFICSWPVQFGREINSSTGLTDFFCEFLKLLQNELQKFTFFLMVSGFTKTITANVFKRASSKLGTVNRHHTEQDLIINV
ncbi:hypothetical protein TYRP_009835 [Tyrophagus putrescentiae]|nr:hypothetical protein TYRP_009835 [Tyrophagus putrescentiae]